MSTILLLSGPNLNLLGDRQPHIYGNATLEDLVRTATKAAEDAGIALEHHQSNSESDLVEAVQQARARCAGIVINPGALTHYGWSLSDALATFGGPVIELHLSNPRRRESWRHTSVITPVATATIAGLGPAGYALAIQAMVTLVTPSQAEKL